MTKAELESKHLSDLHLLAAEAGVPRYRLLSRGELIEQLASGDGNAATATGAGAPEGAEASKAGEGERPRRRRRRAGSPAAERPAGGGEAVEQEERPGERAKRIERERRDVGERAPEREPKPAPSAPAPAARAAAGERPRRRRRRFGRRKQGVTLQGLLLPPEAGRQALLCAETREGCTALLRSVAADLAADSKGPDPVALLIDPSPEELADWKREAPQAEIVSAGQPRHADDALAQARSRAGDGEDVILLVDSLTRLGEAHGDPDAAKDFFDAGRLQGAQGGGSLTVLAALERPEPS